MLKENPKDRELVMANQDDIIDGDQYLTKGNKYRILGFSNVSGYPYFLNDNDERCFIDEESWHLYDLVRESGEYKSIQRVSIGLTGIEIDARRYVDEPTDVSINLSVMTDPMNLLKVMDRLHEDIEKLLEKKYRFNDEK